MGVRQSFVDGSGLDARTVGAIRCVGGRIATTPSVEPGG